jgi:hypothetical protein
MTCSRRFIVWCFGLAAWLWCIAGVSAHEPQTTSQSGTAGHSAATEQPTDIPWDTVEWTERRYKIEALGFKARDETGWDWWGSDEVMVETDDAKGWTVSGEIGSVDSGESHPFDPLRSCLVAVRPGIVVLGKTSVCDEAGEPAPLGFGVEFWEKDPFGLPPGFCVSTSPGPGLHAGPHCANDGNGDDFIGRARIDLSAQDLETTLPNVGDEYVETVVLNPCKSGENVCDVTYGPDYSVTYRITRLRDARVGLRSVLDEAMRKIGTRSELEAIVNGLRSLRAPNPRQIEPDISR